MTKRTQTLVFILMLATGSAVAADRRELITAPDAVLCLDAGSLDQANAGRAQEREWLRELGCMRSPGGIPATLLNVSDAGGPWNVRFKPQGISGGIALWGRASAFTLAEGTPLPTQRAGR